MHEISLQTASKRIRTHALNKVAKVAKQPVWEVMAAIERGDKSFCTEFEGFVSEGIEALLKLVEVGRFRFKRG